MATITTEFGSGGAPLTPHGSDGPSLAGALRDIISDLITITGGKTDGSGVISGLMAADPTTASTQATGTGNTSWHAGNIEAGWALVGDKVAYLALADDFDVHTGSFLTGLTTGKSCKAAIVLKNVSGTVTCVAVKGTPATTGSAVAPTDAEIQAAVGAGNAWVKLFECTINRTGDLTVTESRDLTKRNVSLGTGVGSATLLSKLG